MREFATPVQVASTRHLVDIVGTGGDGSHSFNTTTSVFVAAAAGARVTKHASRGASSKSGSADVMEALGACIPLKADEVRPASTRPASLLCSRPATIRR